LSVNGVTWKTCNTSDDIIANRARGADAGPGEALCLRFRPDGNTQGETQTRQEASALNDTSSSPLSALEIYRQPVRNRGRRIDARKEMLGVT
jgi:hypothetical protein